MPSPCACRRNGTTRAMPWVVDPLENLARTASSWTGPSHGGIARRHDRNPAFSCGLFGSRIQTKRFPSLPPPRSVCTSEPPIANARLNVPTNPFLHMRGRYVHVHLLCPRISFLPFPSLLLSSLRIGTSCLDPTTKFPTQPGGLPLSPRTVPGSTWLRTRERKGGDRREARSAWSLQAT